MKKGQIASTKGSNTVYFDAAGDVRLLVESPEGETALVVSSKAMTMACKPWTAMLGPYFSEGQPEHDKEIPLPDDNLKALSILLRIAHLQFNQVPSKLEFHELLEVAILSDKYQATPLVVPWLSNWIKQLEHLIDVAGYESWLWIAWEFGRTDIFERVATRLVLKSCSGSEREGLILKDARTVSSDYIPPDITDNILQTRVNTIRGLLEVVQSYVEIYSETPYSKPPGMCNVGTAGAECDAIILGSLIQKLVRRKLWPMEDPANINTSVESLSQSLLSMDILFYPGLEKTYGGYGSERKAHAICNITKPMREEINKVLKEIPSVLQPSHKRHMQAQRDKLLSSHISPQSSG